MFHVVHEDGDEEDLWAEEAEAARRAYAEHEATGGVPPTPGSADAARGGGAEEEEYVNKLERRPALRISRRTLGGRATRGAAGAGGGAPHGPAARRIDVDARPRRPARVALSCRGSTSVVELAQLLAALEERCATSKTWRPRPTSERKPWRKDGHPFIGKTARRFFAGWGASDGVIVGWLPPEDDDPALWHMVHGDNEDEEDLDEAEAQFAIDNMRENRAEATPEEVEYLAKFEEAEAEKEAAEAAEIVGVEEDEEDDGGAYDDDDDDDDAYVPDGRAGGAREHARRRARPAARGAQRRDGRRERLDQEAAVGERREPRAVAPESAGHTDSCGGVARNGLPAHALPCVRS